MTSKDQSDHHNCTGQSDETDPTSDSGAGSAVRRCPDPGNGLAAPQTMLQEVLLNVWAGILGTDKIGIAADFFELGGDSVLATQVVSRLRDLFRMDLPP